MVIVGVGQVWLKLETGFQTTCSVGFAHEINAEMDAYSAVV